MVSDRGNGNGKNKISCDNLEKEISKMYHLSRCKTDAETAYDSQSVMKIIRRKLRQLGWTIYDAIPSLLIDTRGCSTIFVTGGCANLGCYCDRDGDG